MAFKLVSCLKKIKTCIQKAGVLHPVGKTAHAVNLWWKDVLHHDNHVIFVEKQ